MRRGPRVGGSRRVNGSKVYFYADPLKRYVILRIDVSVSKYIFLRRVTVSGHDTPKCFFTHACSWKLSMRVLAIRGVFLHLGVYFYTPGGVFLHLEVYFYTHMRGARDGVKIHLEV